MAEPSIAEILEETTERCRNLDAPLAGRLQAFADEVRALDADFATPTAKLSEQGEHYRALLAHALSLTKPEFNEEMRHGHTNM